MGNKTGPLVYLGLPISLFGGEFSKQDSYVSKGGPLGGVGEEYSWKSDQLLNTEDRKGLGVWSTLATDEGLVRG